MEPKTNRTEVRFSQTHKWHVLYNSELALRGLKSQELAEVAAVDIAANGGRLPRKQKRSNKLDLRDMSHQEEA